MSKKSTELDKVAGDKIIVNDISTDVEFVIASKKDYNTLEVNLVIEEDGNIHWYLHPERSDIILKEAYVLVPTASDDEIVQQIIKETYYV